MKRAKGLILIVTIATLAIGSVTTAFAAAATAAAPATTAAAKKYSNLSVTAKSFYGNNSVDYGSYPVLGSDYDATNKKIKALIDKSYFSVYNSDTQNFDKRNFSIDYKSVDTERYTELTVNVNFVNTQLYSKSTTVPTVYYIDKETKKELADKKAFDAAIAEQKNATTAAAATPDPFKLVSLRDNCAILDYEVGYDADTGEIVITGNGKEIKLTIEKNVYPGVADGKLETGPIFHDGTLSVPASFFEKVLKAKVTTGADGTITISK